MNPVLMLCGKCSVPLWSNSPLNISVQKVMFCSPMSLKTLWDPHPLLTKGGVNDKHEKACVAAKDTAVQWHLSCKNLRAVCRS